ncbi:aminoglycoside phosphotransferase family protein [Leisingera sp. S132]|uniref:aminoglycoside phosphotransferase family protein n=1 Tax=Leisingera sp. S132 TaxID=2867016 RepID=UPI0021A788E9|nr:aminoglycoside phosphotransferase family protein [Leisingera sp. S132]UWQ81184.1 aminoglycoside phosphotransferase family protein [Leisingera sp. S132]
MLAFADFDENLVRSCVDEFAEATGTNDEFFISCLYRSADFGNERMVFTLVRPSGTPLVLKLDTAENATRLIKEFRVLKELGPHFAKEPRVSLVQPVYLSERGHFHVTGFLEGKTAKAKIYSGCDDLQAGQVYRRCGEWLNHLHACKPPQRRKVHLNWMLEEIETLAQAGSTQASPARVSAYLEKLRQDIQALAESFCREVFSHGDFHGGNLILGQGTSHGLDFTEACTKLAVYDIVDMLKMDIFHPANHEDVGPDGIRRQSRDMFFRKYNMEIISPLLTCCMRGRLLIDYVKITDEAFGRSSFLRKKSGLLETRLSRAFSQPLDG